MVDIAVDRGRNYQNSSLDILVKEVLGQVDTVSQAARRTDKDQSVQTELLASLCRGLLIFRRADLVAASSDVVDTTEVPVIPKAVSRHRLVLHMNYAVNTAEETDEFDVLIVLSEAQKTINDVVCARCLASHIGETDLEGLILVDVDKLLIESGEVLVVLSESLVQQKLVLDFNEVIGRCVVGKFGQLFANQLVNVARLRKEFLDGSDTDQALLELLWDRARL